MDLTNRQRRILEIVVKDYIDIVEPISSHYIETNYDLGVSPATIRNDLKALVEKGYLLQPHTSAGRIPADKGYRYFVNKLLRRKRELKRNRNLEERVRMMEERVQNEVNFLRELTGFLAGLSSSLTYSYLKDKNLLWKEGFEETLHDPEFKEVEKIYSFLNFAKEFEQKFEQKFSRDLDRGEVRIYIGEESPFKNKDFSILVSKCSFSNNEEGIVALLGPKRMAYDKNISLINSLVKLLENGYDKKRDDK
ncbi:MAG: DeoR family transcriptional regulator [Patescibacteria group bacterium]